MFQVAPRKRSALLFFAIPLLFAAPLFAGLLTVTVRDPGKAQVPDAAVSVLSQIPPTQDENIPRRRITDATGRATFDQLQPGPYRVTVTKEGLAVWDGPVTIGTRTSDLQVALKLDPVVASAEASTRRSSLLNSDSNYQTLRTGKLIRVYGVSNLVMQRDAGTFTFRAGSFSFLPPVLGHVTTGVFIGEGNFQLKPEPGSFEATHLHRMMDSDSINEDFTALVVFFSDSTFDEIKEHSTLLDETPQRHEEALKRVRNILETRHFPNSDPSAPPLSLLERLLNYEDIPNLDAEVLAELYNGAPANGDTAGSFRAFINGRKYSDLRFILNPHGAMPMLLAPEEVAVLNFNPNSNHDGIWYLSHTVRELQSGRLDSKPDSKEDKRLLATTHYKLEPVIGSLRLFGTQPDLTATCNLTFRANESGVRMVKFDLFPDLEVSRVTWNNQEIPFIQEGKTHDGSFYLQMPEVLTKDRDYNITFEYGGVILKNWYGNIPGAWAWYPMPAGSANRATYDLIYHVPQGGAFLSVGKNIGQSKDGSRIISQWTIDVPIRKADFHWLDSATLDSEIEESTKTHMSLYSSLKGYGIVPPSRNYMLGDFGNAIRLFTTWFGKSAYSDLSMLVQTPGPTGAPFGSIPGVVFSPTVLMAGSASVSSQVGISLRPEIRPILDEGFSRFVAAQWWGHSLSPASFHDLWLVVGLTSFSGTVYDLAVPALGSDSFKNHWVTARESLLSGTRQSTPRPNDAGPLWMGFLNDTPVTPKVPGILNSAKAPYVIQMLRAMMWDPQTLDRDFQTMLQDFVATYINHSVSSEDFQSIVEKHMKQPMDWFFNEWLHGTDIPSYRLEYSYSGTQLEGKLTQSGVSPSFRMPVPIFAQIGNKHYRIDVVPMQGNSTSEFHATLSAHPDKILLNANDDLLADKIEIISPKQSTH